jgi:hypothetical protein
LASRTHAAPQTVTNALRIAVVGDEWRPRPLALNLAAP